MKYNILKDQSLIRELDARVHHHEPSMALAIARPSKGY